MGKRDCRIILLKDKGSLLELLSKIDRERPLVSLFAEPTNLFSPDCIIAFSRGKRIGRVADDSVGKVKSLLAQNEDPILFARVEDVTIKEHGHLSGGLHEAGKAYEAFRRHEAENDRYLEFEVKKNIVGFT